MLTKSRGLILPFGPIFLSVSAIGTAPDLAHPPGCLVGGRTEMIRAKPVALLSPSEKMPFEVMPVVLALKRQDPVNASATVSH
jgi:hypothetical protein